MGKLQKPCPGVKWQNHTEQRAFSHLFYGTTKISKTITKSWSKVTSLLGLGLERALYYQFAWKYVRDHNGRDWNVDAHVEKYYDVTSILEVRYLVYIDYWNGWKRTSHIISPVWFPGQATFPVLDVNFLGWKHQSHNTLVWFKLFISNFFYSRLQDIANFKFVVCFWNYGWFRRVVWCIPPF